MSESQELKSENQKFKEGLQSVFCNSVETLEAVTTSTKEQSVMRGKEFVFFMSKAKRAVAKGDTDIVHHNINLVPYGNLYETSLQL
jgi:hypothetical protein